MSDEPLDAPWPEVKPADPDSPWLLAEIMREMRENEQWWRHAIWRRRSGSLGIGFLCRKGRRVRYVESWRVCEEKINGETHEYKISDVKADAAHFRGCGEHGRCTEGCLERWLASPGSEAAEPST
jgi:hypothetical protein